MGKNPAYQFYPMDWIRDMSGHPLEIQGAWKRILCFLHYEPERGKAQKTVGEWAGILGVTTRKTMSILTYLYDRQIADVTFCNANVTLRNKNVTVVSRRMHKEWKEKQSTKLRVKRHRMKRECNADVTVPSSSSSSSSKYKDKEKAIAESDVDYIGEVMAKVDGIRVDDPYTFKHPNRAQHAVIVRGFPDKIWRMALNSTQDAHQSGTIKSEPGKYLIGCLKSLAKAHNVPLPKGWKG